MLPPLFLYKYAVKATPVYRRGATQASPPPIRTSPAPTRLFYDGSQIRIIQICSQSYTCLPARGDASIPTTHPHLSRPYAAFLDETLAIATVSRDLVYDCAILDEQQAFKAFAKLACFAVAHEYGVTGLEWYSTLVPDGGLNLASPFERNEPGAVWQVGPRLLFGAY